MEKALEILREYRSLQFGWNDTEKREEISEAIAELEEAMKPKTCDGCIYENKDGVLNVECAFCLRNSNDNFEPKDNK